MAHAVAITIYGIKETTKWQTGALSSRGLSAFRRTRTNTPW
jgi:hypothetical protein